MADRLAPVVAKFKSGAVTVRVTNDSGGVSNDVIVGVAFDIFD